MIQRMISTMFGFFMAAAAHAATAPLTLVQAIQYAQEHSPAVDSARRTARVGELQYRSSIAAFLPSLDFTTTNGLLKHRPAVTSDPYSSTMSLQLTEKLYDNGESLTKFRIADVNEDLAKLSYLNVRDKLTLEVAVAFYRYSQAAKLAEVRRQQQKMLARQFSSVQAQYRQGVKTRQDFLRFKTQLQRSDLDLLAAGTDIARAETELRRALGAPVGAADAAARAFVAVEPPAPSPAERSTLRFPEQAPPFEKNYQFRLAELRRRIEGLNQYLVVRKYWPQVSLTGAGTYQNSDYLGPDRPAFSAGNQWSWSALVTFQYNIWDWGTRRRDVEVSEHAQAIAFNDLDLGLQRTAAEIANLMTELKLQKANYQLNAELLNLSQESYEFLEQEYRLGRISYLDIITGLNDLLDAKVKFYSTYFGSLQSLAQYKFHEGSLNDLVTRQ